MKRIHRCVVLVLVLVATPHLASAQAPEWASDLADEIARDVERNADRIARHVERHVEKFGRLIEQRLEAQRGRRIGRGFPRGPEFTDTFSRTVRLGRTGSFDLQNVSGDIVVTGGSGDDVRIEAIKRVRHPNEADARSLLSEIGIQVEERSGRVEVRTEYPRRRNWSGGVDFTVSLPRDASVTLRSVSGNVRVTSVNGELRTETVSGDVITAGTRRLRLAKTVSGNLDISDAEGDEITAGSVSGQVTANRLKANGLDAQSVSGDLRLTDVELDRMSLQSVSGNVEYVGRLQRNGRYQIESHSGNVRVTPIDSRGFSVEATTFSGDVRSDYALTLQSVPGNGFGPGRRNRSIRGSFGDASATLTLQSFSGNITIVRR